MNPALALAAAAVLLVVPALPAGAQETAPAQTGGQAGEAGATDLFVLAPAEGRHLRMDRRSGRLSVCEADAGGQWLCRLVPDDRDAYDEELATLRVENERLAAEVAALTARIAELEADRNWIGPEDEKKLDEMLDFSEKAFRRFHGMVDDLRRDFEGDAGGEAAPEGGSGQ